jgi:DNA-binding response OmpR family regulator
MRVLIVEDDPLLAANIAAALAGASMVPSIIDNGALADHQLSQAFRLQHSFDAVVLDLTLPGMDGMDVLAAMRRRKDPTPVLILSARVTLADRIGGLEGGADDYLPKPFEPAELVVRLRTIARRVEATRETKPQVGKLEFDAGRGTFMVDGGVMTLLPKAHSILEQLFRKRGHQVRKELLTNLTEGGSSIEAVDTQISRLRKRLREVGAGVSIRTLHGIGYILEAEGAPSAAGE